MTYEDFVMRTARQQRTARTVAEAFRTPTYAASITKFYPSYYHTIVELRPWFNLAIIVLLTVNGVTSLLEIL